MTGVLARPGEGAEARSYCGPDDVEVLEMPLDDSWIRDSGPDLVRNQAGELAVADFAFDSWGECYLPDAEPNAQSANVTPMSTP